MRHLYSFRKYLRTLSGHLVIRRLRFTPECKIGDPEQQNRAEPCWTVDPELSCVTTHLQQRGCSCSVLSHMRARILCTGSVWPQLSLYLQAGLRGKADLSPEATSKRAESAQGSRPARTAAASLGFGSRGAGSGGYRRGWRWAEIGGEAVGALLWSKSCVCVCCSTWTDLMCFGFTSEGMCVCSSHHRASPHPEGVTGPLWWEVMAPRTWRPQLHGGPCG